MVVRQNSSCIPDTKRDATCKLAVRLTLLATAWAPHFALQKTRAWEFTPDTNPGNRKQGWKKVQQAEGKKAVQKSAKKCKKCATHEKILQEACEFWEFSELNSISKGNIKGKNEQNCRRNQTAPLSRFHSDLQNFNFFDPWGQNGVFFITRETALREISQ